MGGSALSLTQAKDEEVAEPCFKEWDITEGWGSSVGPAEVFPLVKDGEAPGASLGAKSGVSGVQRKAEISCEAISGRRGSCFQGFGSG